MKKLFTLIAVAVGMTGTLNAQALKGLKDKVNNTIMGTSTQQTTENSGAATTEEKQEVKSTLTEFQRSNLNKILFFSMDALDTEWNGETASDCITEIELGQQFFMRSYFDNGGWDSSNDNWLDVRFTCNGKSFTGYEFTKMAYLMVDKAPSQNAFGHYVKFETANTPNSTMMQETKEWINMTLMAHRGGYIQYMMRVEDTYRYFLAAKLKDDIKMGAALDIKVELYRINVSGYSPSATPVVGDVYSSGTIRVKVTEMANDIATPMYRMFSEGLVDAELSAATAKQIVTKFPTTVKSVERVFFVDNDFTINYNYNGEPISRSIKAWVVFQDSNGIYFNTKTLLTYQTGDKGATYSMYPLEMESGLEEATFPVISGFAIGK